MTAGVNNPLLHKEVKDFVVSAFQMLEECIQSGDPVPTTFGDFVGTYTEDTGLYKKGDANFYKSPVPDFENFIQGHLHEIERLSQYISCANFMLKDQIIRKKYESLPFVIKPFIYIDEDVEPYITVRDAYLVPFLIKLAKDLRGFKFNGEIFETYFVELENFLYSEELHFQAFCPLPNFRAEAEEINFGDRLEIRKISADEAIELWHLIKEEGFHFIRFLEWSAVITKLKITGNQVFPEVPQEAFDLITALRLFKNGYIHYSGTLFFVDPPPPWKVSISSRAHVYGKAPQLTYTLSKQEVSEFKIFYDSYSKLATMDRLKVYGLRVAINRFNCALDEITLEDKLIDLVIALESLYVSEVGELSYRLSLMASVLLGENKHHRKTVFETISEAYRVRSKIIHGGTVGIIKIEEKRISLADLVERTEEYVRASIKAFLNLSKYYNNYEEIINRVRDAILDTRIIERLRKESALCI